MDEKQLWIQIQSEDEDAKGNLQLELLIPLGVKLLWDCLRPPLSLTHLYSQTWVDGDGDIDNCRPELWHTDHWCPSCPWQLVLARTPLQEKEWVVNIFETLVRGLILLEKRKTFLVCVFALLRYFCGAQLWFDSIDGSPKGLHKPREKETRPQ